MRGIRDRTIRSNTQKEKPPTEEREVRGYQNIYAWGGRLEPVESRSCLLYRDAPVRGGGRLLGSSQERKSSGMRGGHWRWVMRWVFPVVG